MRFFILNFGNFFPMSPKPFYHFKLLLSWRISDPSLTPIILKHIIESHHSIISCILFMIDSADIHVRQYKFSSKMSYAVALLVIVCFLEGSIRLIWELITNRHQNPNPDMLNDNLHFNKIPGWSKCTLNSEKLWFRVPRPRFWSCYAA